MRLDRMHAAVRLVPKFNFGKRRTAKLGSLLALATLAGCPWFTPILSISPTAQRFDAEKADSTMVISNAGGGTLEWSVSAKPDWLTVTPSSGAVTSDSQVIKLQADFTRIAPGIHVGELALTSNGGDRAVALSITVVAAPQLEVSPDFIDFGGSATMRTFQIRNTGGGTLEWDVLPPLSNWLTVNPSSGETPAGQSDTVTLRIDRSGLAPGTQVGPVLVQLASNAGSAIVTVQAMVQYFFVDPTVLDFGALINELPFTIRNTSAEDDIHWTINAASLPAWATLTPSEFAGTLTPGQEGAILVSIDRALAGTGSVTGEIRFSSDGGQETVLLSVQGPQPVLYVNPTTFDFGSSKTQDALTVENTGSGTLEWTIEEGIGTGGEFTAQDLPWLNLSAMSGEALSNEMDSVTLQVDRSQVSQNPSAPYEGSLRVRSQDGQEMILPVSMMALPPTLKVLPTQLSFGTTYVQRILAIWNGGLGLVNWRIDTSSKPSWLSLAPVDGAGIASGSVSGEQTDSVKVIVDRTGISPATVDYSWTFQVTAEDGSGEPLPAISVTVSMNVARVPVISIDSGESPDGVPNVDTSGISFIPLGTVNNSGTFRVRNLGTGTLSWHVSSTNIPAWLTSIEPAQGTLGPQEEMIVTVRVSRAGLPFGTAAFTLNIASNDPVHATVPVRVEMQIAKVAEIGVKPAEIAMGLYVVSGSFEVANTGDPGSMLNFQIVSTKPWLHFYPETGLSEGTASLIKDWRGVDISVNRAQLTGTGDTGELIVTAFEVDENGQRRLIDTIKEKRVTVSVQAAPLSFEGATARTRIPSLVRFTMMMRDIAYDALPLPENLLDQYVRSFSIFEKDVPIEMPETNVFLTSGSVLRTNVAILLDYSGSMMDDAKSVSDPAIANAPDPLQALYELCVANLIRELPDSYNVALMEFHERSQPTRFVNPSGPMFTTDKDLLLERLSSINIIDHGATELLPAVVDAAYLLDDYDVSKFNRSFDDADVRALVCITDGRLTTPPGRTKDALDQLTGLRIRFFPVGWGKSVLHEPLARLGSGSGGHYYQTTAERTGRNNPDGSPILRPVVSELMNWCETKDPAQFPCDQSVSKDLTSQVVLSYVTLTEDVPVTVRVDAKFDNPNDDDGLCLVDQGLISGSFTQKQLDFLAIAGDVRLGQISLRSEGLQGDRARLIVRAEYVPRNIEAIEFTMTALHPVNSPTILDGILSGWSLTDLGGGRYRLSSPAGAGPLAYGAFGDLVVFEFPDPIPPAGTTVSFAVTDPVYDAADSQGKYFIAPDTITVSSLGSFAPAFPTPAIKVTSPASDARVIDFGSAVNTASIELRNIGGNHVPTGVWLNWKVTDLPVFLTVDTIQGSLISTIETDALTVTLDRSIPPDDYVAYVYLTFDTNLLGAEAITTPITVYMTIENPVLSLTSQYFAPGTTTLDFGTTETSQPFTIRNTGQSTLNWRIDTAGFPDWLDVAPTSGQVPLTTTSVVTVVADRAGLASNTYTHNFIVQSDGGSQTVTVTMVVP